MQEVIVWCCKCTLQSGIEGGRSSRRGVAKSLKPNIRGVAINKGAGKMS